MTSIGQKLKVHQAILAGKPIEFRAHRGDGTWVRCWAGLLNWNGQIETAWNDGDYRVMEGA